ncbi:MAG: hypothetical protein ACREJC_20685 [Tepidisphaeraceae bacterium]
MSVRRNTPARPSPKPPQIAPLKPQRSLFFALLFVFLVWVGMLLAIYLKTRR